MKYHLNPSTGEPGECTAEVRSCPWGDATQHYSSEDSARVAYEQNKKDDLFATISKSEPLPVYQNKDEQEFWNEIREKIGVVVHGGKEFAVQPNNPDASTVYCMDCTQIISKTNSYFTARKGSTCEHCGRGLESYFATSAVLSRDALKYLDDANVKSTSWFHTTQNPEWADSLENPDRNFVHMGTEKAAEDRCETLQNDSSKPTYLYELEIDQEARIHDVVYYEDPYQDDGPNGASDPKDYPKIDFNGVTRYINEMEDVGSISLVANPKTLKIKSVRIVRQPRTEKIH